MVNEKEKGGSARERWARFRFGIIAALLSAPPEVGELCASIEALAAKMWRHPSTGEAVRFSAKTIERWYYAAKGEDEPIRALERKVPSHAGTHPSISEPQAAAIRKLRQEHPRWTFQLVHDNLQALARQQTELGTPPGYATVCRYMKHHGLLKGRRPRRHEQEPGYTALERRSYEVGYVHGLWHSDFHKCSRKVLLPSAEWIQPVLFGLLDDRSRLCCHVQWYASEEETESFVHGLCQGLQKRDRPRALMTDRGAAMMAAETQEGLARLSIEHHPTLSQTPEQNGKQEVFWSQVEGRLMAMLEGEKELTLELLNRATQAWVEQEYNRSVHSETKQTPLDRWLAGPSVGRPCPQSDELRRAFRMEVSRIQRRSDGTITVEGVRFELPNIYRTLLRPTVRVARWDLSAIDLVDPRRGTFLATLLPVDKEKNAERRRRALDAPTPLYPAPTAVGIAPLLRELMAEYAATGLPPAYVPHHPQRTIAVPAEADEENQS